MASEIYRGLSVQNFGQIRLDLTFLLHDVYGVSFYRTQCTYVVLQVCQCQPETLCSWSSLGLALCYEVFVCHPSVVCL